MIIPLQPFEKKAALTFQNAALSIRSSGREIRRDVQELTTTCTPLTTTQPSPERNQAMADAKLLHKATIIQFHMDIGIMPMLELTFTSFKKSEA